MTTTSSSATSVKFPLSFALDTFGDLMHDEEDRPLSHAQNIRDIVEQGCLAGQVGLEFFGIGGHHTADFPMSSGDVVGGAFPARTSRLRLASAGTVLTAHGQLPT